jgi:hypothetical protein
LIRNLRIPLILAMAFAFAGASARADIVYTATRGVGSGTVNISITTDGTLGALATANILDWTISMVDGLDSFTLLGPLSGSNSQVLIGGAALTATAVDLLFDYDAVGNNYGLFQSPTIGSAQLFYSFQTNGGFDFGGPAEAIDPRTNFTYVKSARSGTQVIASAATVVATPEPSAIGLALSGLIGIGGYGAMRRARRGAAA